MNPNEIRTLLQGDQAWSVFALADLHPSVAHHCQWHTAGDAVMLLYTGFDPPVLFTHGDVTELLPQLDAARVSLQIKPETLPLLKRTYRIEHLRTMWRMVLEKPTPAPTQTHKLTADHLKALETLHEDGRATGEAPEFFAPFMLTDGVFHGLSVNGELVAAAGTYMVVPEEGVAAIGHVYTRRDQRGQGYAGLVTSAVAAELAAKGCGVIALNVEQHNTSAVRVYEKLGFRRHCAFHEGVAVKLL